MSVLLIRPYASWPKGETITMDDETEGALVQQGFAEPAANFKGDPAHYPLPPVTPVAPDKPEQTASLLTPKADKSEDKEVKDDKDDKDKLGTWLGDKTK